MIKKYCVISKENNLNSICKSGLSHDEAETALCSLINSGLEEAYIGDDITPDQAYIAVKDGCVDGACFTHSEDSPQWVDDMVSKGFSVQILDRAKAKEVLFARIDTSRLRDVTAN
jgi:hypothetical protein